MECHCWYTVSSAPSTTHQMLYFHMLHGACQGSGKTFTMSGREDVLELEEYEGVHLCPFPPSTCAVAFV